MFEHFTRHISYHSPFKIYIPYQVGLRQNPQPQCAMLSSIGITTRNVLALLLPTPF
jgi:hypothetical protein